MCYERRSRTLPARRNMAPSSGVVLRAANQNKMLACGKHSTTTAAQRSWLRGKGRSFLKALFRKCLPSPPAQCVHWAPSPEEEGFPPTNGFGGEIFKRGMWCSAQRVKNHLLACGQSLTRNKKWPRRRHRNPRDRKSQNKRKNPPLSEWVFELLRYRALLCPS